MIHRADLVNNPDILYIFGDNLDRTGFGGQAKEMRGEPNAFGIATKRHASHNYPGDFMFDHQIGAPGIIDNEFKELELTLRSCQYRALVIPLDGIGTGLSKLPEYAPKLLEYINQKLKDLEKL